jgi:hypothetical protein
MQMVPYRHTIASMFSPLTFMFGFQYSVELAACKLTAMEKDDLKLFNFW